jgi:hypothetical protein
MDTVTGLIWLQDASCLAFQTYSAANQAAAGLADGQCGLTDGSSAGDWRLPTSAEWEATIAQALRLGCFSGVPSLTNDPGTACLSVGPTSFTGVLNLSYWSSSAHEDIPFHAWDVDLAQGGIVDAAKAVGNLAWPVRGGK